MKFLERVLDFLFDDPPESKRPKGFETTICGVRVFANYQLTNKQREWLYARIQGVLDRTEATYDPNVIYLDEVHCFRGRTPEIQMAYHPVAEFASSQSETSERTVDR